MSSYNIDDILNANDSDEDVDENMSVDLEKLLDDDDDDDDDDDGDSIGRGVGERIDLHLYSDDDSDDNTTKNIIQEQPLSPSELFAHDSYNPNSDDPELDDLLRDDADDMTTDEENLSSTLPNSSSSSSLHHSNSLNALSSSNRVTHSHVSPLHTLELAEKREKRHMYTGDKETVSALQSKLQSNNNSSENNTSEMAENSDDSSVNGISHFKCVCLEMISTQLHRNSQFKQHGPGTATVVKFTQKFIALGTTRGLVLIFDHNQEMRQVIGSSVPTAGRNVYAVSSLEVSAAGDTIFCGYENGEVIIWDLAKGSLIKRISDLHTGRIVRLCLVYGIGEDAVGLTGISNEYSIIIVDSKGVVNKVKLSKSMFMSVTVDSECLLDGSAGSILDLSPLVSFQSLSSYPGIVTGEDTTSSTTSAPPARTAITDCPAYIPRTDQYIALNSSVRSYIIRVYPQVKIVHRWVAPPNIVQRNKDIALSKKSVASTSSPSSQSPEVDMTTTTPSTSTMNIPAKNSVSLDWTWMPTSYYSELKVASKNAKSLTNPDGPAIHPVVVRGWGNTVEVMALIPPTMTSTYNPVTGTSTPVSSGDIEAVVLASHTLSNDIITVKWLSNHTSMVVLTTKDVLVLNVPSFSNERLPITKEVNDILSQHMLARSLDNIPSISICVARERMYMLATDKMYMFYLQSWQEQAEQLLTEGQWLDALALVLDRYKNLEGSLTATQQEKEERFLQDYIKRYADLAVMRNNDMSSTLMMSTSSLLSGDSSGRGKSSSHHFLVASICIEYCLLAGGSLPTEVLYGDIYSGFVSAQQQSIFMEALEPFTIRRQITDLPTKVFSDLVEYCNRSQQFGLLERIVCHLDLNDIDVDTLIRTLKRARLYSGFLYVHAYGLNDYGGAFQSVFEDMLVVTNRAKEKVSGGYQFPTPQQVDIGYKLILFIKYAANGQVYPRGGKTVVSALCLTQLIELLICKQYPPVPVSNNLSASKNTSASPNTMSAAALTSPQMNFSYPFLFSLAKIDLYALFHTLAQAFKTIYGNSDNGNIVKLNNNNLYFTSFGAMFVSVLNFAKYADSHSGTGSSSTKGDGGNSHGISSFNIAHQLCFFDLFLDLVTTCNVFFSMEFLCAVIQHCQKHVKQPTGRAEELIDSLITRQMKYLPPTAQVYQTLAAELEQNSFFMSALKLCTANSKYKYKPTIETLRTAIVCYIHNNHVKSSTNSATDEALRIFPYIHEFFDHLDNTTSSDPEGDYVQSCHVLIEFIQDLAGVNLHNTQLLMVMYLHEHVTLMMEKTKKTQKLQFDLLDALVCGVENTTITTTHSSASVLKTQSDKETESNKNVDFIEESKGENETTDTGVPQPAVVEELLLPTTPLSDRHVLVYISQLATFQPQQVLAFLTTHSNYPLDEALSVCKQKSIFNATSYLLERRGDSSAALELCLMEISNTLPQFVSKVEGMVQEALQQSGNGNSNVTTLSSSYCKSNSFTKSMSLLQLLKNPSPSKLIEVFQHLEEFTQFNEIIQMITGICSRIDSKTSSSYQHWFHVLDQLLKVKHSLNNGGSGSGNTKESILNDLGSTEVESQMARELVSLVAGQALKAFMSQMGGTVPSQDIVRRITQEEMMGSRFSEFKDVMISMVDSYTYEIALYKTCLRITTSDLLLIRAKRMKLKHRGVRYSESKMAPPVVNVDEDLMVSDAFSSASKSFEPVNHRTTHVLAGGLARKRNSVDIGKKEAFTETTNLIDMAARVVISTELPQPASGFDLINAELEARVPGSLPHEASFVATYDGF